MDFTSDGARIGFQSGFGTVICSIPTAYGLKIHYFLFHPGVSGCLSPDLLQDGFTFLPLVLLQPQTPKLD